MAANRNPPRSDPCAAPEILTLAALPGARDPTPRKFWESGEFRKSQELLEPPKNHWGLVGTCGAGPRPQETELRKPVARKSGPSLQQISTLPDRAPAVPEILESARFGAHDPRSREFWKSGEFRNARESQIPGEPWGAGAAGLRAQITELRKLLSPEIRPGLLPIATPQIRPQQRPKSSYWRPVWGRRIRRPSNAGNLANFGNRGNSRNPRETVLVGVQVTWEAGTRPQITGLRKLLAPEIRPGWLPIGTPSDPTPRGARNPQYGDPIRRAGFDGAATLEIWRVSESAGIPQIPEKLWRGA